MADSSTSNLLSRAGLRLVVGYAVAVVSVVVAFVAARAFLHFDRFWYGEIRPGILALILAVLILAFLFQPEVDWISRITFDFVLLFSGLHVTSDLKRLSHQLS